MGCVTCQHDENMCMDSCIPRRSHMFYSYRITRIFPLFTNLVPSGAVGHLQLQTMSRNNPCLPFPIIFQCYPWCCFFLETGGVFGVAADP